MLAVRHSSRMIGALALVGAVASRRTDNGEFGTTVVATDLEEEPTRDIGTGPLVGTYSEMPKEVRALDIRAGEDPEDDEDLEEEDEDLDDEDDDEDDPEDADEDDEDDDDEEDDDL